MGQSLTHGYNPQALSYFWLGLCYAFIWISMAKVKGKSIQYIDFTSVSIGRNTYTRVGRNTHRRALVKVIKESSQTTQGCLYADPSLPDFRLCIVLFTFAILQNVMIISRSLRYQPLGAIKPRLQSHVLPSSLSFQSSPVLQAS